MKTSLLGAGFVACMIIGAQISHLTAQTVNSVEAGIAQLAQTISARSSAAELTRIAVLPFPNADGTCSVLSNFLVDELILSLFSLPKSKLEIVERSQLEALLTELKMGEGGLLNPATTRELGNLSGVGALTLGTITVIGDAVRVNARLVATDTGRTISAAAVTVPKTQALDALLKQPVTTGPTCEKRSARAQTQSANSSAELSDGLVVEQFGLQLIVTDAVRSPDNSKITLKIRLTNTVKDTFGIIWVQPVPEISDGRGNNMLLANLVGNEQCSSGSTNWFNWPTQQCWSYWAERYTWIESGKQSYATLQFRQWEDGKGSKTIETDFISFSAKIQMALTGPDYSGNVKTTNVSITIPKIDLAKIE